MTTDSELGRTITAVVERIIVPMAAAIDTMRTAIEDNAQRLDRIEASLERTSQLLELVSSLAERNVRDIEEVRQLTLANASAIAENGQLFRLMLEENRADRQEWRSRIAQIEDVA